MNKGFTLVETLVAMTLLLLAVMFSSRIIVSALDQSRRSAMRFRLVEALDHYRNHLSSLPMAAPELAAGAHSLKDREFRVDWYVDTALKVPAEGTGAFLKRVRLQVAGAQGSLPLVLYRSRFIQEVKE